MLGSIFPAALIRALYAARQVESFMQGCSDFPERLARQLNLLMVESIGSCGSECELNLSARLGSLRAQLRVALSSNDGINRTRNCVAFIFDVLRSPVIPALGFCWVVWIKHRISNLEL